MNVDAGAREVPVGSDRDTHQRIAGAPAAGAGCALALEADYLVVFDASGNCDVDGAAGAHADALLGPANGFKKIYLQR